MSQETEQLLASAREALDSLDARHATRMFSDPQTHLLSPEPSSEKVEQLLPTLKARLRNSSVTGKRIYGIARAIERLERLPSSTRVLGYGLVSPQAAGNLYFTESGHQAVGAAIVAVDR